MPTIDPNIIHTLSTFAYVVSNLATAGFCWGHMCRPFDRNPRRYYPARPVATVAMTCTLMLMPYVLWPADDTTWLWARIYTGIGIPLLWVSVALAMRPFLIQAHRYDMSHYSNEDQFSLRFYKKLMWIIVSYNVMAVVAAAIGNRWVMDAAMVFMACYTVYMFLHALHPYGFPVSEREEKLPPPLAESETETKTDIKQIDALIRSQQLYTDPNLTLDDVARQLKVRPADINAMLSQRDISFYYYINNLRMEQRLHQWEEQGGYADANLNIDTLADSLQTNTNFLKNFFRCHLHTNPSTWLTELRVRHAQQLLLNHPDMQIELVADRVGYASASGLTRKFKEIVGTTPAQWRREQTR